MPQYTMITFRCAKQRMTQHGVPFLGKQRTCGLRELDIKANDVVLAQTSGLNLTLKPFHAPDDTKVVEMFGCFSLSMLRQQIRKELGIGIKQQRWLIRSGGRLISDDKDCCDIAEYETITIIKDCCCGHPAAAPAKDSHACLSHLSRVQAQMAHPLQLQGVQA